MDNKKIAEYLLKIQMDDLKDADMLIEYAQKIAIEGDTSVANALYSRAKTRLSQMNECKRTIEAVMSRAEQEAAMSGNPVTTANIYSEMYADWINSWEEKLLHKMM
ncbi:MAG: hypothetical protein J6S85_01685 [Methanobrevibacter sp.]|nr:hypothetical protein [Methanobrevibacter sp.]MBO7712246.1 hypothetical protein [Methanobrevibacter sp.]